MTGRETISDYESQIETYRRMMEETISGDMSAAERELFARLYQYVKETYGGHLDAAERALREKAFSPDTPVIYTALAKRAAWRNGAPEGFCEMPEKRGAEIGAPDGFREMPEKRGVEIGASGSPMFGVFLGGPYERFVELTDEDGRRRAAEAEVRFRNGTEFQSVPCLLRRNSAFIAAEQPLYRLFRQYALEAPVIFSPLARRLAEVIFPDTDLSPETIAEFRFRDPAIQADVIGTTLTHTLVWNVENLEKRDFIPGRYQLKPWSDAEREQYLIPGLRGPGAQWKFDACEPDDYVIVYGPNVERAVIRREAHSILIALDTEDGPDFFSKARIRKAEKIVPQRLTPLLGEGAPMMFRNWFRPTAFRTRRVRTTADILYESGRFNENPYGVTVTLNPLRPVTRGSAADERRRILPYLDGWRYTDGYRRADGWRGGEAERPIPYPARTFACQLLFSAAPDCPLWLAEDYARYALDYLEHAYPEMVWTGAWNPDGDSGT